MLVGASQVNISPETPCEIQGHYYLRIGKKILDPIYASSVVLDNGTTIIAIISCDVLWIVQEDISYIRERIHIELGIEPCNIMVSATHNHQGPIMCHNDIGLGSIKDEAKHQKLLEGIVMSAIEAFNNRKPARIGYGKGTVEKCGFNRRYIMSDGKSKMNPFGVNNPDRLMVEGPVDKEVQVIWFEDLDGNHISIIVNFSSHPAILFSTQYVSADFPGAMRKDIQTLYGSNIPILYLQGACGNIDTFDFENDDNWGKNIDGYKRIGRILAGEVAKILSGGYAEKKGDAPFSIARKVLQLPYKEICEEEAISVREQWKHMTKEEKEKMPFDKKVNSIRLMHLSSLKKKSDHHPVEIAVIRIGDIIFATNPGEYFVEYQLALKNRFENNNILVMSLTNGSVGYIPTKQAIALGGYEVISTMFTNEAGSMILNGWIDLINNLINYEDCL